MSGYFLRVCPICHSVTWRVGRCIWHEDVKVPQQPEWDRLIVDLNSKASVLVTMSRRQVEVEHSGNEIKVQQLGLL